MRLYWKKCRYVLFKTSYNYWSIFIVENTTSRPIIVWNHITISSRKPQKKNSENKFYLFLDSFLKLRRYKRFFGSLDAIENSGFIEREKFWSEWFVDQNPHHKTNDFIFPCCCSKYFFYYGKKLQIFAYKDAKLLAVVFISLWKVFICHCLFP